MFLRRGPRRAQIVSQFAGRSRSSAEPLGPTTARIAGSSAALPTLSVAPNDRFGGSLSYTGPEFSSRSVSFASTRAQLHQLVLLGGCDVVVDVGLTDPAADRLDRDAEVGGDLVLNQLTTTSDSSWAREHPSRPGHTGRKRCQPNPGQTQEAARCRRSGCRAPVACANGLTDACRPPSCAGPEAPTARTSVRSSHGSRGPQQGGGRARPTDELGGASTPGSGHDPGKLASRPPSDTSNLARGAG